MGVVNAFPLHERAARQVVCSELFEELVVDNGGFDKHVLLDGLNRTSVDTEVGFDPGEEGGENLAAKHIARSANTNGIFFTIEVESRVSVAPAVFVPVVELDAATGVVVNDLGVGLAINLDSFGGNVLFLSRELAINLF
jgi:hypothetical protein